MTCDGVITGDDYGREGVSVRGGEGGTSGELLTRHS